MLSPYRVLDLTDERGRALLTRLVETADFFIESGVPGALAALGLGWDALSEINPALIMASVLGMSREEIDALVAEDVLDVAASLEVVHGFDTAEAVSALTRLLR